MRSNLIGPILILKVSINRGEFMSYCPECRGEFRSEMATCPECEVTLQEKLADDPVKEETLGVALTVTQEENAYIIRGFLESEGIPCQLENVSFHAGPAPVGELTKVRLWTKKEDVEFVRHLVEDHENFATCSDCGHVASAEDTTCDFCGGEFD